MTPVAWLVSNPYAPGTTGASAQLDNIEQFQLSNGMMGTAGGLSIVTEQMSIPWGMMSRFSYETTRGFVEVKLGMKDEAQPAIVPLFSGVLDEWEWNPASGRMTLVCRDRGALLQERSVSARVFAPNTTVSDAVTSIATSAGLRLASAVSILDGNRQPIRMGTFYRGNNYFVANPEPAWGLLLHLAKKTNSVIYFLPTGELYFGLRNRWTLLGHKVPTLSWSTVGRSDFLSLRITHTPFRHGSFVQVVTSHDRKNGTAVHGTAAYIGPSVSLDAAGGSPIVPEVIKESGGTVVQVPAVPDLAGIEVGSTVPELQATYGPMPVYSQNEASLAPDECSIAALSHAQQLAAQEVVLSAGVMGSEFYFTPGAAFYVQGTGDPQVDGELFIVAHVMSHFSVKDRGFVQELECWREDRQVIGIDFVGPNTDYTATKGPGS